MRVTYSKKIAALAPTALALLLWALASVEHARERQAESDFQVFSSHLAQRQYPDARADIERAVALSPGNAYYLAGRGLLLTRLSRRKFDADAFLEKRLTLGEEERKELDAAAQFYQQALSLNPLDDGHYHNLGWLYALREQRDEALRSFRQAVSIDGSVALYHVSLGLLREQGGEQEETRREYGRAVLLSPEVLDSQFFRDFTRRSPEAAGRVVSESIARLEEQLRQSPSPILKGKLGKLYLHANSLEKATAVLKEAVAELPSLPRPWRNLGAVYERQGDEAAMRDCYRKATSLDAGDAVSWSGLGRLYDRLNDKQGATAAYALAVRGWMNMTSEHARRASRIYHVRSAVSDDVVPNGLLAYCGPALDVSGICLRLAELYAEAGDTRQSTYYKELSDKLAP
jgi:tetratricopeptide (TPR) repeat protein